MSRFSDNEDGSPSHNKGWSRPIPRSDDIDPAKAAHIDMLLARYRAKQQLQQYQQQNYPQQNQTQKGV